MSCILLYLHVNAESVGRKYILILEKFFFPIKNPGQTKQSYLNRLWFNIIHIHQNQAVLFLVCLNFTVSHVKLNSR